MSFNHLNEHTQKVLKSFVVGKMPPRIFYELIRDAGDTLEKEEIIELTLILIALVADEREEHNNN